MLLQYKTIRGIERRGAISLNSAGSESILDVGCANGDFLDKLVAKGYDCYGLEIVDGAIRDATAKGVKVTKGSFLESLPYQDDSFDFIFAGDVIEHTLDDDSFLLETRRVLKRGGTLILTTPNLVSLTNRLLVAFGKMPRYAYCEVHYHIYNPKLISSKVENAQFRVAKLESSYVLISPEFNRLIGQIGEQLGSAIPGLGEHIILYAKKPSSA